MNTNPVQAEARMIEYETLVALGAMSVANFLTSDATDIWLVLQDLQEQMISR